MGSSGIAASLSHAGYLRCALYVASGHLPLVVEPWLQLEEQLEGFTKASQLQELAVTTDHQPPPSVEDQLCGDKMVVLQCGL